MKTIERLLIRTPNWLGDIVMALPGIAIARDMYPRAEVTIATPAPFAALFRERTIVGPVDLVSLTGKRSAEAKAIRGRFDAVLLMPNSFGSAWTAWRASVPERWGYASSDRWLLLTKAVPKPRHRVHQSDYYTNLVSRLRPDADDATGLTRDTTYDRLPWIEVTERTRERADALLASRGIAGDRRIVGFAPGAAYGHAKQWPSASVADVIAKVANSRGTTSVLVGAAGDRDAGREIESALGARVGAPALFMNLIGDTDLPQLMGVLSRCEAVISNDSGAMHVAAALGRPIVAVFGPTDERVTAPVGGHAVLHTDVACRPCMLRDCPIDHRCMTRITPDQVERALAERLRA
ncbi:MAG TPA: lipopolysaccharide heptosyltransferase II [Gemmatimonadaceae bacterium]|nr:lipopolysaccharide heptosyltransferase II [Gemmatimonadaceae bacterium]